MCFGHGNLYRSPPPSTTNFAPTGVVREATHDGTFLIRTWISSDLSAGRIRSLFVNRAGGYEHSSNSKSECKSPLLIPATISLWYRSWGSISIFSPATLTYDADESVCTCFFCENLNYVTDFPTIELVICLPTLRASSGLTPFSAMRPEDRLRKAGVEGKEFLSSKNDTSFCMSAMSRDVRAQERSLWSGLHGEVVASWAKFIIDFLTSPHTGMDSRKSRRVLSSNPRPCVSPPPDLMLAINTCKHKHIRQYRFYTSFTLSLLQLTYVCVVEC